MKKIFANLAILGAFATGCCCDYNPCCEPVCPPRACPEKRPHCCPQPHVWDDRCCDPSNYELN